MTFVVFAAAWLPPLLRFAGVLTGDPALAEDVVQEVLLRASKRWNHIGALDHPESYVRKMIVNEYLSWRRRNWRVLPTGAAIETSDRETPDYARDHAERDALLTELGKLPRRQRTVLVLRYYQGLPDTEIADVLGCTPGTVRGYAFRALKTLRVELSPRALAANEEGRQG